MSKQSCSNVLNNRPLIIFIQAEIKSEVWSGLNNRWGKKSVQQFLFDKSWKLKRDKRHNTMLIGDSKTNWNLSAIIRNDSSYKMWNFAPTLNSRILSDLQFKKGIFPKMKTTAMATSATRIKIFCKIHVYV